MKMKSQSGMVCEMCGKEVKSVLRTLIEGTELTVCESCARFGKALEKPLTKDAAAKRLGVLAKTRVVEPERIQIIVPDYASRVKQARERMGLTQDEFAKKLAERTSLISQLESGHFKPGIEIAHKIERLIGVKLVEEFADDAQPSSPDPSKRKTADSFVLGDFIKKK
jgi:putative transcription factor